MGRTWREKERANSVESVCVPEIRLCVCTRDTTVCVYQRYDCVGNIRIKYIVSAWFTSGSSVSGKGTIRDHKGPYGTIRDHTGLYGTIRDHKGP